MFIKSDFIPHIPDCPTYSSNDDGIESLKARGISVKPSHGLPKRIRDASHPHSRCQDPPNHSRSVTGKEDVIIRLDLPTKGASWRSRPFPFFHILSSKDSILAKLPHENFNFQRHFGFPNPLVVTSSQGFFQKSVHRSGRQNSILV
jgi:hypothetical protein